MNILDRDLRFYKCKDFEYNDLIELYLDTSNGFIFDFKVKNDRLYIVIWGSLNNNFFNTETFGKHSESIQIIR